MEDFIPMGEAVIVTISSTVDLITNFGGYAKLYIQAQGADARYSFGATDPTSLFILPVNEARVFNMSSPNLKFKGTTIVVQPGK
jgi:hypothetical protein